MQIAAIEIPRNFRAYFSLHASFDMVIIVDYILRNTPESINVNESSR